MHCSALLSQLRWHKQHSYPKTSIFDVMKTVIAMTLNTALCKITWEHKEENTMLVLYYTCGVSNRPFLYLTQSWGTQHPQANKQPLQWCSDTAFSSYLMAFYGCSHSRRELPPNSPCLLKRVTHSPPDSFSSLFCLENLAVFPNHTVNEHVKSNKVIFKTAI